MKRRLQSGECYVSQETLADRLDISTVDVTALVNGGSLPAPKKVGRFMRWRWLDVDAMIVSSDRKQQRVNTNFAPATDPIMDALARANWDEIAPGPKRRSKP